MKPELDQPTETLRSDIDTTRERMDETIDRLGDRLQGRHLVDEVIGFFRSSSEPGNRGAELRDKVTTTARNAASSVADTVKAHPIPLLLVGAGVAWLIYENRKSSRSRSYDSYDEEYSAYDEDLSGRVHIGVPTSSSESEVEYSGGGYGASVAGAEGGTSDEARSRVQQLKEMSAQRLDSVRERLGSVTGRVRERGSEVYDRARSTVTTTVDQHPIAVGLGCLAAGLLIGLAVSAPEAVTRRIAPTVDRLRDRALQAKNELMQKGKRVAEAASHAAREEARKQGLTPEQLKAEASAVAGRAREAATETARQEGLPGSPNPSSPTPSV